MKDSKPSERSGDSQRVELGRIVGAHALRGQVRVRVFGDSPEHLMECESVWLAGDRDDPNAEPFKAHFEGTGRPNEIRMRLDGIRDRDAAEALRGRLVLADARALPELEPGEFYWHELIGCEVSTESGAAVGVVKEIWETGAHDVLVVRDGAGHQNLIPTASELTREIDLESQRIVVADLPGLIILGDDEESES